MREVLIEVGFDVNAGSIQQLIGQNVSEEEELFPLQHGFVLDPAGRASPMWPTQLELDDRVRFRIFDTTRDPLEDEKGGNKPLLFRAIFRNPNRPNEDRSIFVDTPSPIEAEAFVSRGSATSKVFGHFERNTETQGAFPAWDFAPPVEAAHIVTRRGQQLDRSFMALLLQVESVDRQRTFVLDPEVYVGPIPD